MKRKQGADTPDPHQAAPPLTKKPTLPVRGKEKKKRREGEKTKIERGREKIISPNHQHPVPRRGRLRELGLAQEMLSAFHNVGGDMKQLLQIVDDGQVVDIKGISERSLINHLNKLFISLNLKENGDRGFLLPPNVRPSLDVVGPLIQLVQSPKSSSLIILFRLMMWIL
ncbi:hypothetical protein NC651_030614 [Populus alba x Populus x berolinensis]|nr:hypothetical protein NC651_030614 [Populus alba x Populus x berolinensis]